MVRFQAEQAAKAQLGIASLDERDLFVDTVLMSSVSHAVHLRRASESSSDASYNVPSGKKGATASKAQKINLAEALKNNPFFDDSVLEARNGSPLSASPVQHPEIKPVIVKLPTVRICQCQLRGS